LILSALWETVGAEIDFSTVRFYGWGRNNPSPEMKSEQRSVWAPTKVQFLYKHLNGRYYVRTYAGGKEKWTGLKTTLLSVAKNRMREHLDAAERMKNSGSVAGSAEKFRFGDGVNLYRRDLAAAPLRPKTKEYRENGLKLLLRTWKGIEELSVRKITSRMVEEWLGRLKAESKPHVPKGALKPARHSVGASLTTLKCALDAVRQVLDLAVANGQLPANAARNATVQAFTRKLFKAARREKAEKGGLVLPSKAEFLRILAAVRNAGVNTCIAASEFIEFIAYSGARRNEAIHVCWSDVDFEGEKILLRVTKNGEPRWVPMMREMKRLLQEMLARRNAGQRAAEAGILQVKEAQGFITSACRKEGVKRFTTHALRHLFGTTCLEAGVDARTTAAWMGHKDNGALLLKIYSHVRSEHETAMIKKVSFGSP
jgi:integrase